MTDFESMTRSELRRYVLANRKDQDAIEHLARRALASPTVRNFSFEDIDRLGEILNSCYHRN